MNDIDIWFLVLSLFFPRIALIIAYYSSNIPANTIPFWGDFFMAVFIPRILVVIYIATNIGYGMWFWIHLIFCIFAYLFSAIRTTNSKS
jgi:hypothetical protein